METQLRRITIIGLGLIGGSWGLALKERGVKVRRVGSDRPEVLERALAVGVVDEGSADPLAAARDADLAVVTSDNPRTESPERILDDIEEGMGQTPHLRIVDRRAAILRALSTASR